MNRRTFLPLAGLPLAGLILAAPVATQAQTAPVPIPPAATAPGIAVEQPWMRAALQGGTGGAFLVLRNTGTQPDRLLSASSTAARAVEIHATTRQGDVMRMQPVPSIEVPAGGSVALQPGGLHVMMIGLAEAARPGASLPLELVFERAGAVSVQVPVRAAGAQAPAAAGGQAPNAAGGRAPAGGHSHH